MLRSIQAEATETRNFVTYKETWNLTNELYKWIPLVKFIICQPKEHSHLQTSGYGNAVIFLGIYNLIFHGLN